MRNQIVQDSVKKNVKAIILRSLSKINKFALYATNLVRFVQDQQMSNANLVKSVTFYKTLLVN